MVTQAVDLLSGNIRIELLPFLSFVLVRLELTKADEMFFAPEGLNIFSMK